MDVLRGVAILGIFAMNVLSFALPEQSYFNPASAGAEPFAGSFSGMNAATWFIQSLIFDQKMMSTFAMLFGAGLMVMHLNAVSTGQSRTGIWYRRSFCLLALGLAHSLLLWFGDVLVLYSVCGMALWPLRKLACKWLFALAAIALAAGLIINTLTGFFLHVPLSLGDAARTQLAGDVSHLAADQLAELESRVATADETLATFEPSVLNTQLVAQQHRTVQGYFDFNLAMSLQMLSGYLWALAAPKTLAMMLTGMALCKLGIIQGLASARLYHAWARTLLIFAIPTILLGMWSHHRHDFRFDWYFLFDGHFNYLASAAAAVGLTCLIALWCKSGGSSRLRSALANVGRMSLSCYILQTLLGVGIFSGYGLGYFGALERAWLLPVTMAVWGVCIIFANQWLSKFQQGPLEYLWKTLTYWPRKA